MATGSCWSTPAACRGTPRASRSIGHARARALVRQRLRHDDPIAAWALARQVAVEQDRKLVPLALAPVALLLELEAEVPAAGDRLRVAS